MENTTITNVAQGVLIGNSRDGQNTGQNDSGKQVVDPIAQGFERMMERFDKLESQMDRSDRRVDALETPPIHDPGPLQHTGDDAEWEYDEFGDRSRQDCDVDDRNPNLGLRNRWGNSRGHRGDDNGPGPYRGGHTQPRRNSTDFHQPGYRYNRTNWDLPAHRLGMMRDSSEIGRLCVETHHSVAGCIITIILIIRKGYGCRHPILMARTRLIGFHEFNITSIT